MTINMAGMWSLVLTAHWRRVRAETKHLMVMTTMPRNLPSQGEVRIGCESLYEIHNDDDPVTLTSQAAESRDGMEIRDAKEIITTSQKREAMIMMTIRNTTTAVIKTKLVKTSVKSPIRLKRVAREGTHQTIAE